MTLVRFLDSLFQDGRARLFNVFDRRGQLVPLDAAELTAATDFLESFESAYRIELAHQPPPLSRSAMLWGAQSIHRACCLLAFREVDEQGVERGLAEKCPEAPSPSVVYSVDLTFRFLPDLIRLARAASPDDPLVRVLTGWARDWPLSSVGIPQLGDIDPGSFIENECLRQLYVDRILAEQDESRLDDPRTRQAVLTAVGLHRALAPKLATRLATQ